MQKGLIAVFLLTEKKQKLCFMIRFKEKMRFSMWGWIIDFIVCTCIVTLCQAQ